MTTEQILELAKTCGYSVNIKTNQWECWEEQLIDFTQQIRRTTLFEVVSILQNVPNPEANRAAIHKILNHIEMKLK